MLIKEKNKIINKNENIKSKNLFVYYSSFLFFLSQQQKTYLKKKIFIEKLILHGKKIKFKFIFKKTHAIFMIAF